MDPNGLSWLPSVGIGGMAGIGGAVIDGWSGCKGNGTGITAEDDDELEDELEDWSSRTTIAGCELLEREYVRSSISNAPPESRILLASSVC